MAVVKIDGKEVTVPDKVVEKGEDAIRRVLAASGFPAIEGAKIEINRPGGAGSPAIITASPKPPGKGGPEPVPPATYTEFFARLAAAPEHINPAIELAARVHVAEQDGDQAFITRIINSGELERAVRDGRTEAREVSRALATFGHVLPTTSIDIPVGF